MLSVTTTVLWESATYKTAEDMSEELRKALPDMDEMRKLITENNE